MYIWSLNDGLGSWERIKEWRLNVWRNWETRNHKKAIKMTNWTLWHLNVLVWNYIHQVPSQPNMNRSILIKIYSVAIPAFSSTSPPLSVYAESFVSLSFKINSLPVWVFVSLWNSFIQLGEQNFVSCFSNINILMLQKTKQNKTNQM